MKMKYLILVISMLVAGSSQATGWTWPGYHGCNDVTRYGWVIGASFEHTATYRSPDGPRLGQWMAKYTADNGDVLTHDGKPYDTSAQLLGKINERLAFDEYLGVGHEKMDFCLLGFVLEAVTDSIAGMGEAIANSIDSVRLLSEKCDVVYTPVYPPMGDRELPMLRAFGATNEAWDAWRAEYDAAMVAEGAVSIDAHYDWEATGKMVPQWPLPDFHLTSKSARKAAWRIMREVRGDYVCP